MSPRTVGLGVLWLIIIGLYLWLAPIWVTP
jgi:hypothetical protein